MAQKSLNTIRENELKYKQKIETLENENRLLIKELERFQDIDKCSLKLSSILEEYVYLDINTKMDTIKEASLNVWYGSWQPYNEEYSLHI
jgi:hypothetical protein